jgi:(4-(4-[2-(gamma-L-glutamylamino)ethyl]phenoxymethyl)furan-2-yl)methanamine synthase
MPSDIIGWDVGGAHLKAARVNAAGCVQAAIQVPCALWRGMDELHQAMAAATAHVGQSTRHAVTMTGEMVDWFADRFTGVNEIAHFVVKRLPNCTVHFFRGEGSFVAIDAVKNHAAAIASANWRASVEFVASKVSDGVFVDIGTTTTDIVAINNHVPWFRGHDDYSRLVCGELVYSGVVRTPLMALCERVIFRGETVPVIAEHFATTADVYRVLGALPETADQHPSADGAEKTPSASTRRIARMIGRDVASASFDDWCELANVFRAAQLAKINAALASIDAREALLVGAGVGDFLIRQIAEQSCRRYLSFAQLLELDGVSAESATDIAPAIAVALLALKI